MTVDDETHSCGKKSFYGVQQKNLNEDRTILSAAKCRSMILVSRNMRCMRILAGIPRRVASMGVVDDDIFGQFLAGLATDCKMNDPE